MLSEFDLITKYFTKPISNASLGIGDDCALLMPTPGTQMAISTDMLVSGTHFFPDTDPAFAGADSRVLLREAMKRVEAAGFGVLNIDSTVIAQSPKLASFVPAMIANIAADLGLPEKDINVKAKTNEHLDAVGRKEAIIAQAVVLLGELADEEDHDHDDHDHH